MPTLNNGLSEHPQGEREGKTEKGEKAGDRLEASPR